MAYLNQALPFGLAMNIHMAFDEIKIKRMITDNMMRLFSINIYIERLIYNVLSD